MYVQYFAEKPGLAIRPSPKSAKIVVSPQKDFQRCHLLLCNCNTCKKKVFSCINNLTDLKNMDIFHADFT